MNQIGTPLPALSPQGGERVAEGRERGGSWEVSTVLQPRIWTMNGGARLRRALISQPQESVSPTFATGRGQSRKCLRTRIRLKKVCTKNQSLSSWPFCVIRGGDWGGSSQLN